MPASSAAAARAPMLRRRPRRARPDGRRSARPRRPVAPPRRRADLVAPARQRESRRAREAVVDLRAPRRCSSLCRATTERAVSSNVRARAKVLGRGGVRPVRQRGTALVEQPCRRPARCDPRRAQSHARGRFLRGRFWRARRRTRRSRLVTASSAALTSRRRDHRGRALARGSSPSLAALLRAASPTTSSGAPAARSIACAQLARARRSAPPGRAAATASPATPYRARRVREDYRRVREARRLVRLGDASRNAVSTRYVHDDATRAPHDAASGSAPRLLGGSARGDERLALVAIEGGARVAHRRARAIEQPQRASRTRPARARR